MSNITRIERTCQYCGALFLTRPIDVKNGGGKFCNRECFGKSQRGRMIETPVGTLTLSAAAKALGITIPTLRQYVYWGWIQVVKLKGVRFVPAPEIERYRQRVKNAPSGRPAQDIAKRFWSKVDKSGGPDACWPWTARRERGYGSFRMSENGSAYNVPAPRIAYELTYGPMNDEDQALHHCDNPPCCNPTHLFAGTNLDNVADKVRKGRQPRGEKNASSKLTEAQVLTIRRRFASGLYSREALAREYSVTGTNIGSIIYRRTWRHI